MPEGELLAIVNYTGRPRTIQQEIVDSADCRGPGTGWDDDKRAYEASSAIEGRGQISHLIKGIK